MKTDIEDLWRNGYHTVDGVRLFCRDWRPRQESCLQEVGLPVLALHGSLMQSGLWIAPAEAAGTIRMLCPDQRGFGLSDDPGGDACAAFASDALALAERLLPARYVVMGHSFACSIALEAARMAAASVAAVVLVDPVVRARVATATTPPGPPPEAFARREDAERHFRDTEEGLWPAAALRRMVEDVMMRDGDTGPWRFPYTPARLRRLRDFIASPASDHNLFAKVKAVRCPVLVFRGGMSTRFPPDAEPAFLDLFASKPEVVLCPDSGHFPTATEPDIVTAGLKRFLAGLH